MSLPPELCTSWGRVRGIPLSHQPAFGAWHSSLGSRAEGSVRSYSGRYATTRTGSDHGGGGGGWASRYTRTPHAKFSFMMFWYRCSDPRPPAPRRGGPGADPRVHTGAPKSARAVADVHDVAVTTVLGNVCGMGRGAAAAYSSPADGRWHHSWGPARRNPGVRRSPAAGHEPRDPGEEFPDPQPWHDHDRICGFGLGTARTHRSCPAHTARVRDAALTLRQKGITGFRVLALIRGADEPG